MPSRALRCRPACGQSQVSNKRQAATAAPRRRRARASQQSPPRGAARTTCDAARGGPPRDAREAAAAGVTQAQGGGTSPRSRKGLLSRAGPPTCRSSKVRLDIVPQDEASPNGSGRRRHARVRRVGIPREDGADIVDIARSFQRSGTERVFKGQETHHRRRLKGKKRSRATGLRQRVRDLRDLAAETASAFSDVTLLAQQSTCGPCWR